MSSIIVGSHFTLLQNIEARDKALAAKSVQLDGSQYSIFRVNPLKTSVVRLSNIGRQASVDQVGSTCELFGRVNDLVARCDGSIDVYFQSSEVDNMPKILSRLVIFFTQFYLLFSAPGSGH